MCIRDSYSPFTGKPIVSQSVSDMVDKVKALPKSSTIFLLSPVVRGRKGEYKKDIVNYKKRGFQKIKVDGEYYDIDDFPNLNKKVKHDISIVVDRIVLNSKLGNRLADSIETALKLSDGLLIAEYENETIPKKFRKKESITFSSKFSCPESGFTIEEIEPRLFSFNSPFGACEECEGIGHNLNVDPNLVISDTKKSMQDGAIEPWAKKKYNSQPSNGNQVFRKINRQGYASGWFHIFQVRYPDHEISKWFNKVLVDSSSLKNGLEIGIGIGCIYNAVANN